MKILISLTGPYRAGSNSILLLQGIGLFRQSRYPAFHYMENMGHTPTYTFLQRRYIRALIAPVVFLFTSLNAQDTISMQQQAFGEQFQQRYHFLAGDIVTQSLAGIPSYANLEAGYRSTGGGYRQAQAAPRSKEISFFTEGMRKAGKYLVSGSFSYTHTLQDSVGYTLRYGLNDPQPYYLFAYKRGNWQVGQYRLNGSASRSFLQDRLTAGLAVDYNSINGWRSNDPRPEQFSFNLDVNGALLYRILPGHTIGLSGNVIRRSAETAVQYRNEDYQLSLAYPDYVNRIQYGYGFEDRSSGSALKSSGPGYGWKAVYSGSFSFGDIIVKGGYKNLDADIEGEKSVFHPDGKYGAFYEDIWNASLYWTRTGKKNRFSVLAEYVNHLGRDFNHFLKAENYVYSLEQLLIQPLFARVKNDVIQYELGIDLRLRDLFRADGNTGTLADYQQAEAAVTAAYYSRFPNKALLKTKITAGYKQAIDPLFNKPVQESVFISSVIYHDYYFFNADAWHIDLDLLYSIPVKKINAYIRMQAGYEGATIPVSDIPATAMPGNKRWYWQTGLGVSL